MFRVFEHLLLGWLIYISLSFNLQVESGLLYLVHEWPSIKEQLIVDGYKKIWKFYSIQVVEPTFFFVVRAIS